MYNCECGKQYKDRHNLYRHKKTCKFDPRIEKSVKLKTIIIDIIQKNEDISKENQEIKRLLLEQNKEFKELLMQQNKQHNELNNKFIERNQY